MIRVLVFAVSKNGFIGLESFSSELKVVCHNRYCINVEQLDNKTFKFVKLVIYIESYFTYFIVRRVDMKRTVIGALIGFAVGLYVVSTLSINLFSEMSCATPLFVLGFTFIIFIIMAGFCFFGIYLVLDRKESIERK